MTRLSSGMGELHLRGRAADGRSWRVAVLVSGLAAVAAVAWALLATAPARAVVPEYEVSEVPAPDPQARSNFGERLRTLGDVDDDGARDVLISSSNFDGSDGSGGTLANSGRLYVFSGRTRALLRRIDPPTPQANAKFGFWSANLGDVNGDRAADFVVSAPSQVVGGVTVGQVYVYSGRTGTLIRTINPPEPLGMTGMFGGDFGGNLIAPGDLTGDGVGDFVASASGAFDGSGAAYAFNGATGAFLNKVSNPSPQPSSLGFGAAELGDTDGDGAGDYQLGAPRFDEGAVMDSGRSYIISGRTGAVRFTLQNPEPDANDRFGQADADGVSLGDVTGDGTPDIYVDTFLGDEPSPEAGAPPLVNAGSVHLFNGATGTFIRQLRDPTPQANGSFGASNAGGGDVDGDGRQDAVVSSRGAGRVTIFGGLGLESVLKEFQDPQVQTPGSLFGSSISSPGDVNGDGGPDYFISSRLADVNGATDVGTAYAYVSQVPMAPDDNTGGGGGQGRSPSPTPTPTPTARVAPNMVRPSVRAAQRGSRIVVRVSGRMTGVRGRACGGRVKVGVRSANRGRAQRTVRMSSSCRYKATLAYSVKRLPRRLRPRRRVLIARVTARFQGNRGLTGDLSPTRRARVTR